MLRIKDPYTEKHFKYWLNDIFDPLFQLSTFLINTLTSQSTTPQTKNNIYFMLQTSFSFVPSLIPQFQGNIPLINQIISDINNITKQSENTSHKNIIEFFVSIYDSKDFFPLITEEFISSLFDYVKYIDNDEMFSKLLNVLIDINAGYVSIEENKFLNVYHVHPNGRVIDEVLLRMLNYENDKDNILKILLLMNNVFEKEQKNVLYARDLDAIVDIILVKFETIYAEEIKYFLLMLLQTVVSLKDYYKEQYKMNVIMDFMETLKENEEASEGLKKLGKNILVIMNKNIREKMGLPPEEEDEEEEEEDEGEGEGNE
jgi:hypothetical protein